MPRATAGLIAVAALMQAAQRPPAIQTLAEEVAALNAGEAVRFFNDAIEGGSISMTGARIG